MLKAAAMVLAVAMFGFCAAPITQAGNSKSSSGSDAGQRHWSFKPLRKVPLPTVANVDWIKTPIDRFILAPLEERGMAPARAADKRTLIRRASFDLIGLPPTPEEVDRFLADPAPMAFSKLVDRLLDSPHYGERWGRHWLDLARYADNKGYVFFEEKTYPWAWTYRDYVVRAFNEDKPFDQFVLEQLAADQLDPGRDNLRLAALGFLTVGDHFSNNTHDILDDRIDVISRGLLGLTVACARCHDHKFDPISAADYYSLYGILRSASEPMVPPALEEPALKEDYELFELELISRESKLREFVESKHSAIVQGARKRIADYLMAVYAQRGQPPTENFMLIADKEDVNPTVVARWRGYLERAGPENPIWAPWHAYAALDEAQFAARAPAAHATFKEADWLNPRVAAAICEDPPVSMKEVAANYAALLISIEKQWQDALSEAVRRAEDAPRQLSDPASEGLRRVLYGPDSPCDVPAQMDWGFLSLLPDRASQGDFQKLLKALEEWLMNGPEAPARAMTLRDLAAPHEPRIFERGNPNRPGASVPRRFLQVLDPTGRPFVRGSGRLELAQSIVDPANPLTARVFMNRVWLHHFGSGLVTTPSDFGTRSEPPSHPELLDWLAEEFVRSGWSVKRMHRLIMNSAVYQLSSAATNEESSVGSTNSLSVEAIGALDPENRLLLRRNRRRHDFETQRDALLAVAGSLDLKLGGRPVHLESNRRTLYAFVNRLDVPPVMTTFDFPSPSTSCSQRADTTSAPQALYWLNNDFVAACADSLLRRPDVAELDSVSSKIERLYALVFSRRPGVSDWARAREFLGEGPSEKAWQQYAHALLLANEFVFVD